MKGATSIVIAALLAVCLSVGSAAWWFDTRVADSESFVASTTVALSTEDSHIAIGELMAERLTAEVPILVLIESSLASLFSNLLAVPALESVIVFVSRSVHQKMFAGESGPVVVNLEQYRVDIMAPIEAIAPELAALVPADWFSSIEVISAQSVPDLSDRAISAPRTVAIAIAAVIVLALLLLWVERERRRVIRLIGGAFVVGGLMTGLLVPYGRGRAVVAADTEQAEVLYLSIYNELTQSLIRQSATLMLIGVAALIVAVVWPSRTHE